MTPKALSREIKIEECTFCGGSGQEIIGENRVSMDMAIDAGDRSMEGVFHSYAYGECEQCEGRGCIEVLLTKENK